MLFCIVDIIVKLPQLTLESNAIYNSSQPYVIRENCEKGEMIPMG